MRRYAGSGASGWRAGCGNWYDQSLLRRLHRFSLDEDYGAFASRSTVLGGSAVFDAANALLAKIRAAAGARLAVPANRSNGRMDPPALPTGHSLAFAELAADGLRVTTAFGNDNRLIYTYGSAAAHVAVRMVAGLNSCSRIGS
jgi:CO/xanthine dehydrogenase Mo-binding subunit